MSATSAAPARGVREQSGHATEPSRRLSTETKAAFKTTEFGAAFAKTTP